MAGSFGDEAGHYSTSEAIGRIPFDRVETSPGEQVAPGVSCRVQPGDECEESIPTPAERVTAAPA
jgi:hypothetical protein